MNIKHITRGVVATVAALLIAQAAKADNLYNISIDTSSLGAGASAPYYLDFFFAGVDGLNSATFSSFNFAGSSAGLNGSITTSGTVSGDTSSSIVETGAGVGSDWYQAINAGTTLISFNLDLTTLTPSGTTPDLLTISILDSTTAAIPTTDAASSLLSFTIGNDGSFTSNSYTGIAPTTVSASVTAVPEPSTYALVGLGALALVVAYRRRAA